ncbi:MAG: UDP-N-acetylmuramoyl-L-alanyl-D-glutamate--2,6-diaminopimelate ligase, partial [Bacteroidetes bacterium]|nr:UDP-N-acetylmuramoyl-L-alanyl-D-glutamate--2,6-diaminopimelate ligase [Bacteroidota bacterium]
QRAGCGACSMEVSSHALDQYRVRIQDFDVGVFTNLTCEHLDYHGTEEAYLRAKKRLFDGLRPDAVAVVNADDPSTAEIVATSKARVISYGCNPEADVRTEILDDAITGLQMRLDGTICSFNLVGRFNAWNIAAAYAAGIGLEISGSRVLDALTKAAPIPGRFELLRGRSGKSIIVDYAHTPDALQNVLRAAAHIKQRDALLWCVFGCGGDRDRGKRAAMGRIAEELADHVIVTSDNPRTEDPERILRDIRRGMKFPDRAFWIADRREAIRTASEQSKAGDMVLIAGKGHETYQVIGTENLPFDDRAEVRCAFGSEATTGPESAKRMRPVNAT